MTIAEIHGKISSSGSNLSDRLEDLLTSDVFGPLRYLPFREGLLPVLGEARLYNDSNTNLKHNLSNDISELDVCFWPRKERSEPDVLIKCDDHLLMIEAKYLSVKSGEYDEANPESASDDQLLREFQDLKDEGCSKYSLIYLTAHRTLPMDDIESSYKAIDEVYKDDRKKREEYKDGYKRNVYWLSWFDVHKTIKGLTGNFERNENIHKKFILDDISHLLNKKGFRKFDGFMGLGIKSVDHADKVIFYKRDMGFAGLKLMEVNIASDAIFYQQNI